MYIGNTLDNFNQFFLKIFDVKYSIDYSNVNYLKELKIFFKKNRSDVVVLLNPSIEVYEYFIDADVNIILYLTRVLDYLSYIKYSPKEVIVVSKFLYEYYSNMFFLKQCSVVLENLDNFFDKIKNDLYKIDSSDLFYVLDDVCDFNILEILFRNNNRFIYCSYKNNKYFDKFFIRNSSVCVKYYPLFEYFNVLYNCNILTITSGKYEFPISLYLSYKLNPEGRRIWISDYIEDFVSESISIEKSKFVKNDFKSLFT